MFEVNNIEVTQKHIIPEIKSILNIFTIIYINVCTDFFSFCINLFKLSPLLLQIVTLYSLLTIPNLSKNSNYYCHFSL